MNGSVSMDWSASESQLVRRGEDHPTRAMQRSATSRANSDQDAGGSPLVAQPLTPGNKAWESATKLVLGSKRMLLICHISPDGDAIGSLLGLGLGLRRLNKTPTLACEDAPPEKFGFLPGFETIVNRVDDDAHDLVIGLDSSDPSRLGNLYDAQRMPSIPLINIDHHVTNLHFGDVNLVDPEAASTAEIILLLLDHLGVLGIREDRGGTESIYDLADIATCLLTGIVTDTVGFRTSNVTKRVMHAAMRLMEEGASLSQVTHHSFNQRPLTELNLLAQGLSRMQADSGLAWSEITLADLNKHAKVDSGDAGLVGMLARTREVHMAAVFTEKQNNRVEISFRADPGFDVSQLALTLGGGGHPAASGCTVQGSLESAKARVLPMMRAALEEQKTQRLEILNE